eukprot:7897086-Prorocentrum_lima.AAC.1
MDLLDSRQLCSSLIIDVELEELKDASFHIFMVLQGHRQPTCSLLADWDGSDARACSTWSSIFGS